jgi:lactoylglutathione lyase
MKYLHTMIRVSNPAETIRFFELLGLRETRRMESEKGRYTLIYLAAPGDEHAEVELTHNWDEKGYDGGRNFGHLAYRVENIYALCQTLMDAGITVNRPPRDGHMAFVRTPDHISIELLQAGKPLAPAEPWASMPNTGSW